MSKRWCSATPTGIRLAVQITPNAKKTEVVDIFEDVVKLKLHAPPVDGKANEALIRYIADVLHVPKTSISITHGFTSKRKLLEIRAPHVTIEAVTAAFSV